MTKCAKSMKIFSSLCKTTFWSDVKNMIFNPRKSIKAGLTKFIKLCKKV